MTNVLFTKLTEEFDNRIGSLINYIDVYGHAIAERAHYDLRTFLNDNITVPRTMLDLKYNTISALDGTQMILLDTPRVVTGQSLAARSIASVETLSPLDSYTMSQLELYVTAGGGENWPIGDAAVTYGKDSARRYSNSINIALVSGVTKIISSHHFDNVLSFVSEGELDLPTYLTYGAGIYGSSYYGGVSTVSAYTIELALPGFPAQTAPAHLDLANSWIDFSSDPTGSFDSAQTDSFTFNQSINNLSFGGNLYFQITLDMLTHCNLSALQYVRFRLKSIGDMTFTAQALRIINDTKYFFDAIDIDTRQQVFRRSIPRAGAPELTNPLQGTFFMNETMPRNGTFALKFNSGHLPIGNTTTVSFFGRATFPDAGYIRGELLLSSAATKLSLYELINGHEQLISQSVFSALTNEMDYVLLLDLYEDTTRLTLNKTNGAQIGAAIGSTNWQATSIIGRGDIGFGLNPYNYDFFIDYITTNNAEFARLESEVFTSLTPILGATLAATTSPDISIGAGHFIAAGDATLTTDATVGNPAPSQKFVRDGTDFQGGYMTDDYIFIGNTSYIQIKGDIFPVLSAGQTGVRGSFRIVLLDKNDSVGYITTLPRLIPSQWNSFDVRINAGPIMPGNYRILLQQVGYYNDTFDVDNFTISHPAVGWEISPDHGTTWIPFLTAINEPYAAVNFGNLATREFKLRAKVFCDTGWISNYELVPKYGFLGQSNNIIPGTRLAEGSWAARVTPMGTQVPQIIDARIRGNQLISSGFGARITGA